MFKKIVAISISFILAASALMSVALIPSSAEEPIVIPDSQTVAKEALDAAAEKQHPYLMYESDDIAALKDKINSGNSKKAFEVIGETVGTCIKKSFTVTSSANGIIGRQLQYCVMYLSTYSLLTDDESYAYKAVEQTLSCAEQGDVDIYFAINDALCVGDFGYAYALAYDTLYDYMTEDERAIIKAEMEEIGAWIYENSPKINTWGSEDENRKAWNWNAISHGALGMISLSLGEHPEWLALATERAYGYFSYAVDSTGAGMEGLHYIGYALNTLVPMDYAIYRLTDLELLDYFPAFRNMTYWSMLYMTVPQGGEQVAINQGDILANYSGPYYIINRYRQSDALWAWEHTFGLEGDGKFDVEYQGNGWSAPAIIFFEDQTLTPTKPTEQSNSLTVTFDKGLIVARDSWEDTASMFTFTCGRGYGGCWNHPDDNSFTFHARGESFIIDLGANFKESKEHNIVLVNGKGMDYTGGSIMREGEILDNRVLENGNVYVAGSNSSSYWKPALDKTIRQIVYGGGDVPFLVVFDYVKCETTDNTFNINFFTHENVTATVRGDSYAILTSESGQECFVIPYSPDGATIKSNTVGNADCLTTETKGRFMRQATVFIMAEEDGDMPDVFFSTEGKETTVTIARTVNGQEETETYVFSLENLVEFTTTEKPEIEEETTVETEETVIETEVGSESETEKASDTETSDSTSGKNDGCFSSLSAGAIIPTAAAGAAIFTFAKKKKRTK